MATSAQDLIEIVAAQNYDALSAQGVKECILATIGSGGGGGGVTSIIAGTGISVNQATGAVTVTNTGSSNDSYGHGDPSAPPSDTAKIGYYTDLDNGTIWSWSVPGQVWI